MPVRFGRKLGASRAGRSAVLAREGLAWLRPHARAAGQAATLVERGPAGPGCGALVTASARGAGAPGPVLWDRGEIPQVSTLPLPPPRGLRCPQSPTQGRPPLGPLGVVLGPGPGLFCPRREPGISRVARVRVGGTTAETRTPQRPPGSSPREAGDQRPLPCGAPRRTRPGTRPAPAPPPRRCLPISGLPARASRTPYCYANIKEVKGAPARRACECSCAWGGVWGPRGSRSPSEQGPGERGAAARARPAPRAQLLPPSPARRAQLDVAGVPRRRPPAPSAWSAQGRRAGPGGAAPSMHRGAPGGSWGPVLQPLHELSPDPACGLRPAAA